MYFLYSQSLKKRGMIILKRISKVQEQERSNLELLYAKNLFMFTSLYSLIIIF